MSATISADIEADPSVAESFIIDFMIVYRNIYLPPSFIAIFLCGFLTPIDEYSRIQGGTMDTGVEAGYKCLVDCLLV